MVTPVRSPISTSLVGLTLAVVALRGCRPGGTGRVTASAVERYVDQVESVRLAVNDLLEGADPILDDYRSYRVTPDQAAPRMGDLGSQFAAQLVTVESITAGHPVLVADLPHGDFADLPNTQNDQRQAIIEWWTQLEVLARQTGAGLPDDLHRAGRGEIAPSPTES